MDTTDPLCLPTRQEAAGAVARATERMVSVDALRGMALFGILYVHMVLWYTAGPLPESVFAKDYGPASAVTMTIVFFLFVAKFFSIFSFLFGLSFYIQMQSLIRRDGNFVLRFSWRLVVLGLLGLIHHALWRGDILTIYVPLGFLLIVARNLSNRVILCLGIALVLNLPTRLVELVPMVMHVPSPFVDGGTQMGPQAYYEFVKNTPFPAMVASNLFSFPDKWHYQIYSGRLLITFGFFLLGMFVGRMRWFEQFDASRPRFRSVFYRAVMVLLITLGVAAVLHFGLKPPDSALMGWTTNLLVDLFNSSLTILYIAGFTLLMHRERWRRILSPLASVGRMALTSYITQSVVGVLLFYRVGLGLFDRTTPAMNTLMCFAIFGLQMVFSAWWLKRFHYGPVEWLWRSATFLLPQKMTIKKGLPVGSPSGAGDAV